MTHYSPISAYSMQFTYKNHRGETSKRHVYSMCIGFGSTDWHPEPQWIMKAYDLDKQASRYFAMKDMSNITITRYPGEHRRTSHAV